MNLKNLIGNTPLVKLDYFSSKNINIYAKLEGQNIGGSIKDRVALALIEDLEKTGQLTKEKTIIEPSSGNTGIGLAMIGAAQGYKVKIIMPESATKERVAMLKFFGAQVEFCSKEDWKGNAAIEQIKTLAAKDPLLVMPNQYENPVCANIHHSSTGAEIVQQLPNMTHFVSTMGTGGTITGVAKKLREFNPNIQTIGAEVKTGSLIAGPRSLEKYTPPIIDFDVIDKRVMIEDEDKVFDLQKTIAQKTGLFVGPSSAAALSIALQTKDLPGFPPSLRLRRTSKNLEGLEKNIVIIFPDRGEKYLSNL